MCVGEDVESREVSDAVGGSVEFYSHFGAPFLETACLPCDPVVTLSVRPREVETCPQKDVYQNIPNSQELKTNPVPVGR